MPETPRTHIWSQALQSLCWLLVNKDVRSGEILEEAARYHSIPINDAQLSFGMPALGQFPCAVIFPVTGRDERGLFFFTGADVMVLDQASGQDHESCLDMIEWAERLSRLLSADWKRVSRVIKLSRVSQLDFDHEAGFNRIGELQQYNHFTLRLSLEFIQQQGREGL